MTKKILNQNDIINTEIVNSYDLDCIFSNNPINRVKNEPLAERKTEQLKKLKEKNFLQKMQKRIGMLIKKSLLANIIYLKNTINLLKKIT